MFAWLPALKSLFHAAVGLVLRMPPVPLRTSGTIHDLYRGNHCRDFPESAAKLIIHLGQRASPGPAWHRGRELINVLPEAHEDPKTMRWWAEQPGAWAACRTQTRDPERAMRSFDTWVRTHALTAGTPVMVAYPAAFDTMWVEWYLHRFVGDSAFRRRAIDVKTLAMVAMGKGYRRAMKARMPRHWHAVARHTHVAVDDAIEQGELFMNIVRELNAQRPSDPE